MSRGARSRSPDTWRAWWAVVWDSRWRILSFVVLGFAILLVLWRFRAQPSDPAANGFVNHVWTPFVEPMVGLGTLAVAVAVWLRTRKGAWEEGLRKVLDVDFVDSKSQKPFIQVREAPLDGPSDIRAWTQQFGRTLNNGGTITLALNYEVERPTIERDSRGRWVQRWRCVYPTLNWHGLNHGLCQVTFDPFTTTPPDSDCKELNAIFNMQSAKGAVRA